MVRAAKSLDALHGSHLPHLAIEFTEHVEQKLIYFLSETINSHHPVVEFPDD